MSPAESLELDFFWAAARSTVVSCRPKGMTQAGDARAAIEMDTAHDAAVGPKIPPWRVRLAALRNLGPLLRMVFETDPRLAAAAMLCRLVRGIAPVIALYIAKLIIDSVVAALAHADMDVSRIWFLLSAELGLTVAMELAARTTALLDSLLGDRFATRSNIEMMRHAATLDLAQFEAPEFQDKLVRARQNVMGRVQLAFQMMTAGQDLATFAILASALVFFSPLLLLLLVLSIVPSFVGETHFAFLGYSFLRGWTPQRRALDYFAALGASPESAAEVKMFGLGDYLVNRYRRLADMFYAENRSLAIRRFSNGAVLGLLGTFAYYAAYAVIISRTVHGALSVGDLTFLSASFARARRLIEGILATFSSVTEQTLYLSDFFDFFRTKPKIVSQPLAFSVPRPLVEGISFRDVSFRYPGAVRDALTGISFTLRAGERLALVGENGAGKTTLVKLIARLYDPTAGEITLDGRNLREYDLAEWWGEIGIIFQDFMRYSMLLSENIGFGRVEAMNDRDRLQRAADMSLVSEVAARLERGLDQMIGRRFAGGVDLSGGEWQKVALARAYMRRAQLLVLDEPTAGLDANSEKRVFARFDQWTRGKTAVLISHRFSTVRMADRILVLDGGRVAEFGSHRDLLRRDGRYAELFKTQSAAYN